LPPQLGAHLLGLTPAPGLQDLHFCFLSASASVSLKLMLLLQLQELLLEKLTTGDTGAVPVQFLCDVHPQAMPTYAGGLPPIEEKTPW
jgi:hypothetical protein